ncbi:hypothetical protein D3C87_1369330 [compost metagenome]
MLVAPKGSRSEHVLRSPLGKPLEQLVNCRFLSCLAPLRPRINALGKKPREALSFFLGKIKAALGKRTDGVWDGLATLEPGLEVKRLRALVGHTEPESLDPRVRVSVPIASAGRGEFPDALHRRGHGGFSGQDRLQFPRLPDALGRRWADMKPAES